MSCPFQFEIRFTGEKTFDMEGRKSYEIVFVVFVKVENGVPYLLDPKGPGKRGFWSRVTFKLIAKSIHIA